MTSTPRNIIPVSPEGDEDMSREQQVTRPAAEKVTPSQQGRFLGALEKKEPKKDAKKSSGMAQSEEAEEPVEGPNVFHLAKTKAIRGQSSFAESEEEMGGKEGIMPKKKPSTPTTPSDSSQQQVAAAQAQSQVAAAQAQLQPSMPSVGMTGKGETTPQSTHVKGTTQGPAAQQGAGRTPKETGAFQKLMGEEGKKGRQLPEEAAGAAALPKPVISSPFIAEAPTTADAPKASRQALMEVIRQAADAIATFVSKQETSTLVTIKQPPLFAGATLTVTEYSSAPRQFNITFTNLSPEAQRMVETVANQQQLKQALIERGYIVQNVFIEATPQPLFTSTTSGTGQEGQAPREFDEREGGGGGDAQTGGEAGGAT